MPAPVGRFVSVLIGVLQKFKLSDDVETRGWGVGGLLRSRNSATGRKFMWHLIYSTCISPLRTPEKGNGHLLVKHRKIFRPGNQVRTLTSEAGGQVQVRRGYVFPGPLAD